MRVHRLSITAFGPYATEQVIDFDRLNESGIFLLTGPTGAGKTSVLDAICFALFGSVPGDRNGAKSLKSHHADPTDRPVVELDVSVRGRRFRLRRSPSWTRPSKRARAGRVDEQARAAMSELRDGEWVPLSNRLDEVGHLVTNVIGMNRDQFCQVVMLPQGRFQTFLTAGAKERHDVLEALFETSRFQRIEKWLGEHRRLAERAHADHDQRLRSLAGRIEEANDGSLREAGVAIDEVGLDALAQSIAAAVDAVDEQLASARGLEQLAEVAAKQGRHAVDEARMLADRQQRIHEARRIIDELEATSDVRADRERRVAEAKAADKVWPLAELLLDAERSREAAARAVEVAHAEAASRGVAVREPTPTAAEGAEERLLSRLTLVADLADVERQVVEARDLLTALREQSARLDAESSQRADRRDAIPRELAAAEASLAGLLPLAEGLTGARVRAEAARVRAAAAREAVGAASTVTGVRSLVESRRAAALDAKDAWLAVRAAYLEGWAAMLASDLAPGVGCPVCGAVDHPSPAVAAPGHATAADEAAALAAFEAAESARAAAVDELARADRRLASLEAESLGLTSDQGDAQLRAAEAAVVACESASGDAAATVVRLDALKAEQLAIAAAESSAAAEAAGLAGRREAADARVAELGARLRTVVPEGQTVAVELRLLEAQLDACRRLSQAVRTLDQAAATVAAHRTRSAAALSKAGFAGVEQAAAARLSAADLANAEALNRSAAEAKAAAVRSLADPALLEAAQAPQVDLPALLRALREAEGEHAVHTQLAHRLAERLGRLEVLGAQFAADLEALEPLTRERDLAVRVAAVCAGTSADNATHTRLSHYVLSQRLRQVVDAANERLAGISAGRYELEHQMQRGVGDTRGGLGLRVHDTYTGQSRDPATLSGGETFYVSLSLALGLADLVRDEIGGVELSTLFVDEGFGGLDAETLDEVMDELDSLRSGGRVVGIVSHVQDLRLRVPAQLRVEATPRGSRLVSAD